MIWEVRYNSAGWDAVYAFPVEKNTDILEELLKSDVV
ncbi:hypothetical protein PM8797T_19136 [Gimesia maris DSM 8797]|nr:hypothetical protein PM8797T_19136 [Gimesia maris DSM 8797]|tara:strand:+ start:1190 stop:1300 length:111 start_codon:yes stop_codon:yes gene_type:complete